MNINCSNLKKNYNNKTVLDIENLEIKSGSFVGIIGENGCGKTTLLSILSNILSPDNGTVIYNEEEINEKIRKEITLVFQKPVLINGTVEANIDYPLRLRKIDKSTSKKLISETIDLLNLSLYKKQKAKTLSGGQKQKVALARSLVFSPKLLMLDEPTANIDPVSIIDMENAMIKANRNGTTVILITHNVVQASKLCSRVIFMSEGKIYEDGTVEEVIYNPHKDLTKQFISQVILK